MTLPERDRWHLRGLVRRMVEEEVRRALADLVITPVTALPSASCLQCTAVLDGKRRHAKYCSNRCRVRACRQRRRTVPSARAA